MHRATWFPADANARCCYGLKKSVNPNRTPAPSYDNEAIRLASRRSLEWIFASFSQMVIARSNPREGNMRSAIENQPEQQSLELT
jgi:hypothetical protein